MKRAGAASLIVVLSLTWGSITRAGDHGGQPKWSEDQKDHWAFQRPRDQIIPKVKNVGWVRNPIDAFIASELETVDLEPAPEANRLQLIRRLSFDLTGLPPTLEQIDAYLRDASSNAYEKVVDRLLASPAYGERWARSWLDLARYAESDGFKSDAVRPSAWRYRDWVVRSLNSDMPYDRFVRLQLAGDLIEPGSSEAFIATGFNRNWPFEDNNKVPGLNRQLILDDVTDTTASVFLGLTLACARCHTHKYDPISQKDYYRFQALFAASGPRDDYPLASGEELAMHASVQAEHQARVDSVRRRELEVEEPYRLALLKTKLESLPDDLRRAIQTEPEARSAFQEELLRKNAAKMNVEPKKLEAAMSDTDREVWKSCRRSLDSLAKEAPSDLPTASGMAGLPGEFEPVHLLARGNLSQPQEAVDPGFPSIFGGARQDSIDPRQGRRALAEWLTSPDHPLTARVVVNRIWQGHFGRGLVATASDFGLQGALPTHPELLDWLAVEFVKQGWSLKSIHRLIITSATYRQESIASARSLAVDHENMLYSRMSRRRVEAEAVRDAILLAAGRLDSRVGGPSFFPQLPPGVQPRGGWSPSPMSEQNRRSLYVFVKRNVKLPLFDAFDSPDTNLTCPERNISVNAPQALALLNSDWVLEQAGVLARRVKSSCKEGSAPEYLVERAYRVVLGRPPNAGELERSVRFLQEAAVSPEDALADFCHALINLNEFVFID